MPSRSRRWHRPCRGTLISPVDVTAGPYRRPHPGNYEQGRSGRRPRAVVVHTTDGTFQGTLAWFASAESRVSAHYLVGLGGQVAELVAEEDAAFHAGVRSHPEILVLGDDPPNLVTIGIEFDDGGRPHDVERPRAQYRAGAELLAGISGRWGIPLDRDHILPHHLLSSDKTCPGNLDLDRLLDLARATAAGTNGARPRLAVLLPARNAVADLPGWFESVERFADAVVALDDGSTDETEALLEAHPLVEVLLRNPRRESYEGWDDSANRNRLLAAAADLDPEWILSLDADERIPVDDAAALSEFIATDALPGLAYGMRCYRMVGDAQHYDRDALWVYRLFAFSPGQVFPDARLHFVPIPTSIPRDRRMRTTIRIQHMSSLDSERRAARLEKYRQADPRCDFQVSYDHLVEDPVDVHVFEPRTAGLPVLADQVEVALHGTDVLDPEAPALSAIVISRDDEERIERTVRSVVEQECEEQFEVIVVTSGTDRTAAIVRARFPGVRVVELSHPALPGEARNAGLRLARGAIISFPGSHVELPPGSLAARIRAHDEGWTMVTGTTRNGTGTRAGWAAYFLDHSSVLPDRPSEPLSAAPAHCSYEASALYGTGGFPDDVRAGEDTRVNHALFRSGHSAYRVADLSLVHHNRSRTVRHLLTHHYDRGRAQVQFMCSTANPGDGIRRAREFLWAYPTRRLARIDRNVQAWGGPLRDVYRRVRPLVRLGVLAAWVGGQVELRGARPFGRPRSSGLDATTPLTRPLRLARATSAPVAGARAVFLHIPKTAGSTLFRLLEREYAGSPIFRLYGDVDSRIRLLEAMSIEDLHALRLVGGHMGFGIHRFLPGASAYVTLLRDPVDRVVSHYHYVKSRPHDAGSARAMEGVSSLDDYVRSSVFARIINNGQTRLLGSDVQSADEAADEAALERAKQVIDRSDVVVGLQDRFEESLLLMLQAFGWGYPAYRNENVGVGRPRVEELSGSTVELILERNSLDVELYQHAQHRFERDLAAVVDLDDELELLRLASRWWGSGDVRA